MTFVAKQLMEKAHEHEDSLFMMFMDLKKAVPMQGGLMAGTLEVWCSSTDVGNY